MSHHPSTERPATEAGQDDAAITELCKALDHVREALWLMSDDDSDLAVAAAHVRRTLRSSIVIATNGRIEP